MTNIGFKEIYDHVSVNSLLTCKGRSYPKKLHRLQAPDRKRFLFLFLFVWFFFIVCLFHKYPLNTAFRVFLFLGAVDIFTPPPPPLNVNWAQLFKG